MLIQRVHWVMVWDETGSHECVLTAPIYSVGRDPNCDIRLQSQFASRYHATLIRLDQDGGCVGYRLVDGNYQFVAGDLVGRPSTNGVIVNGQRVRTHDLQAGDVIALGQAHIFYHITSTKPPELNAGSPQPPSVTPDFGAETLPDGGYSQIP